MTRNIYHLDGLQALAHLDAVLALPNLQAKQWGTPPQYWDSGIVIREGLSPTGC